MFMVKRIFHRSGPKLPPGIFSNQPSILAAESPRVGDLKQLLFTACPGCVRTSGMCSIPQGVFAARQVRLNVDRCATASADTDPNVTSKDVFDNQALEQPPLKYNSKLMNSIWGLYNRYSVHNFKKNTDDAMAIPSDMQQCQIDTVAQPNPTEVAPTTSVGGMGLGGTAGGNPPPVGGAINSCRNMFLIALRTI